MNIDESSNLIRVVIPPVDPNAPPVKRPPSSRTIARMREKAEAAARDAAAARALRSQVQPGLKPLAGKLFAVDVGALVLRGPAGGLGSTERMIRTLAPLAAGGRHPAATLVAAGGWRDEAALREALVGIGGKLAAIGLRIERRKAGWRMAKAQSQHYARPHAGPSASSGNRIGPETVYETRQRPGKLVREAIPGTACRPPTTMLCDRTLAAK